MKDGIEIKEEYKLPVDSAIVQGKEYVFLTGEDYETVIKNIGDALGATNTRKCAIAVDTTTSLHQLKDTVLHELIHAIDYGIGAGLKEKQVHTLASALCDLFWSNPDLSYWLINKDIKWVEEAPKKKSKKKPSKKRAEKVKEKELPLKPF